MIALLVAMAAGGGVLWATGQFRGQGTGGASLEDLERKIAAGNADGATWFDYGEALREKKRFAHAAAAYRRSLDLDPDRPMARFDIALSLAQANDADKFFGYFTELTAKDPKQAVDLLDRPELAGLHKDGRWDGVATGARAQAAD